MESLSRKSVTRSFWIAALITFGAFLVPGGEYLIYPFALLATWAHEMGHGLTAILVGGDFEALVLYRDLGGVAFFQIPPTWYAAPLAAAGGLLGPAVVGGATIIASSQETSARRVAGGFALALLLTVLLWARSLFGALALGALCLLYAGVALHAPVRVRIGLAQVTGIQLCLSVWSHWDYLFTPGFERDGQLQKSDTQVIAEALWLPYWVWGSLVGLLAVLILASAFWTAWGRPGPETGAQNRPGS